MAVDVISPQETGAPNGRCGKAVLSGTDTLAGSVATMVDCVVNLREFTECGTVAAIEAATLVPARALGLLPHKGILDVGADGDFILLDENSLQPRATYIAGELAWTASTPISMGRALEQSKL